jgi:hypothetical protein
MATPLKQKTDMHFEVHTCSSIFWVAPFRILLGICQNIADFLNHWNYLVPSVAKWFSITPLFGREKQSLWSGFRGIR